MCSFCCFKGFIREVEDGDGRGRGMDFRDMNINADNLNLNTTTTTSDLHLHSHNCLVGDDVNFNLAKVNKRLKVIYWYSSMLNMLTSISYMAPCISLIISQDLILTGLLLVIFPNSFGKKICGIMRQGNQFSQVQLFEHTSTKNFKIS